MSNSNPNEISIVSGETHENVFPQLSDGIPSSLISSLEEEQKQCPYGPAVIRSEQMITAFVDSRIGGRKENQDSAGFQDTTLGAVIVVCDGMGGMNGGRMASSLAVRTILNTIASAPADADRKGILVKAIKNANEAILAFGAEYPSYAGMGSTATVIIVSRHSVVAAYVGDSRIYQLRGKKKIFRTFDHSMVFEMVKRKALTEEQARLSAQSNIILKALGVSANVDPDVVELSYRKGDRFILCTDGFWGAMPEEEFLGDVSDNGETDKVLAEVMTKVDGIGHRSGGSHDNLTAAFVDMNKDSNLKEKMNRTAKIIIAFLALCLLVSATFNVIPSLSDKKVISENVKSQPDQETLPADNLIYYGSMQTHFKTKRVPNSYALVVGQETAQLFVKKDNWELYELKKKDSADGITRYEQVSVEENPYVLTISSEGVAKLVKGDSEIEDIRKID